MLTYRYTLTPDTNGTLLVQFPDVPEAVSVGDNEEDARVNAQDGLEAALQMYLDARRPVPLPSGVGQDSVSLSASQVSKVLLSNEMIRQGIRKAELARRMGAHAPQVDRLLDLSHSSKFDTIETALRALGKQVEIQLV